MGHHELGSATTALDLRLPRHAEQALLGHEQLHGLHMHGIVEPQRRKDHAEPPPYEKASRRWFQLVTYEHLKAAHELDREGNRLFQRGGPFLGDVRLNSQQSRMSQIRTLDGELRSDPPDGRAK